MTQFCDLPHKLTVRRKGACPSPSSNFLRVPKEATRAGSPSCINRDCDLFAAHKRFVANLEYFTLAFQTFDEESIVWLAE